MLDIKKLFLVTSLSISLINGIIGNPPQSSILPPSPAIPVSPIGRIDEGKDIIFKWTKSDFPYATQVLYTIIIFIKCIVFLYSIGL